MSRLKLVEHTMTPPDKFRFRCPIDGWLSAEHMDRYNWMLDIRKHYRDNGYEIPDDIEEQAEDQLCQFLDGQWCRYCDGSERGQHINRRVGVQTIINGTKVFTKFLLEGAPLVSQEEANRRALICSRCYALDSVQGCGSCLSVAEVVSEVVGAKKTPQDYSLEGKACLVCKCSAKANVWMPVSVSKVGVNDETLKLFPSWCWKKIGILDQSGQPDINESHG